MTDERESQRYMLAIRMQRTGRKGHAMYRVVVQQSRYVPTSGKVVALLGSYDPHTKLVTLDKEKAATFLSNGAQPSDRVARLFASQGVALPDWYKAPVKKETAVRHSDKLRRNQPKAEVVVAEEPVTEAAPVEAAETELTPEA